MAHKKRRVRRRRRVRGGRCGVEKVKGYRRMVCRNTKGRITSSRRVGKRRKKSSHRRKTRHSGGIVCPKGTHKKRIKHSGMRCVRRTAKGGWRFVKAVSHGRGRRKRR